MAATLDDPESPVLGAISLQAALHRADRWFRSCASLSPFTARIDNSGTGRWFMFVPRPTHFGWLLVLILA
jgi:hypothetical protein